MSVYCHPEFNNLYLSILYYVQEIIVHICYTETCYSNSDSSTS
uniref:Uncharacterized protein n=1 Tax=Anguilla anguilla TaxID=7936 RepID=A0A0E9XUC3_ANGAN